MKKSFLFFIVIPLVFFSCINLDEINGRLDDHEARLSKLENLVANANTSISNIQKLVEAQSKKVTIVSYEALPDGFGYVLKMSDGTEITLNNGTDGQSPAIGVKDVDGLLYWTIDGELMRDAKGNPIQAEGQDGESGLTPKIRVNLEGYWEMSLDGGVSWQNILDENGAPVKAVGSDASVDLQITENDEAVTIVFNGQTFVIPKKGNGENPTPERPIIPIDYVAEFNVGVEPNTFTDSQDNDKSGFFTWEEAQTVAPNGYHVPSRYEWAGIIPTYTPNAFDIYLWFTMAKRFDNIQEAAEFGNEKFSHQSHYMSLGKDNKAYGLRFQKCEEEVVSGYAPLSDNSLQCAYRYEVVGKHALNELNSHLKVTVRYLGEDFTGTIEDIANESFWAKDADQDVIKIFPSATYFNPQKQTKLFGLQGFYWSSTAFETDDNLAWNMSYAGFFSYVNYNYKIFGFPVRPFKNKIESK